MKSIKTKLLTGIILINSLILIGICFFKFGFEDFYIKHATKELKNYGKSVEELIDKNNEEELINYIDKQYEDKNISIDIYDEDGSLLFSNSSMPRRGMHKMNKNFITNKYKNLDAYILLDKSKGIEFLATKDISNDNSCFIMCKTPISAIKNSVDIASNFLFMIFIPITLISILMAIYFSNKFTKPIIELNDVSNKIANLNFDEKVNINTNDEIEVLGNSINMLSFKIKESIKDLKDKNEELESLVKYKTNQEKLRREFVSSVSHELKTPITVINGYAEGLRSNILDNEEDKQYYIDVICEESEKMASMVNDLLDLYKLESNTFKVVKEKINLETIINNVAKKHELIIKEKEIRVSLNLKQAYVMGDKIRLEQVLNNLIDNAINHALNEKEININVMEIDDYIRVGVYNSGEKIRKEDLEKIWYSFVRLDKVRNSKENRIGLGLAIVREIISLHDGKYGSENKNNGVEFYIKLKKC